MPGVGLNSWSVQTGPGSASGLSQSLDRLASQMEKAQNRRAAISEERGLMQAPGYMSLVREQINLQREQNQLIKAQRFAELAATRGNLGAHLTLLGEKLSGFAARTGLSSGAAFARMGAGLGGVAYAAGPALGGTLAASFEMLAGEIGVTLAPTIVSLSRAAQHAANWIRNLGDGAGRAMNVLASGGLSAAAGGMLAGRAAGMLGLGAVAAPIGLAASLGGLALGASGATGGEGFAALERPLNEMVRLLGGLVSTLQPILAGLGHFLEGWLGAISTTLEGLNQTLEPIAQWAAGLSGGESSGSSTWSFLRELGAASMNVIPGWSAIARPSLTAGDINRPATAAASSPFAFATGFQSRQIGLEDLHSFIQQEAVRDSAEQARFERHIRALEGMWQIMQAWNGGDPRGVMGASARMQGMPAWFIEWAGLGGTAV